MITLRNFEERDVPSIAHLLNNQKVVQWMTSRVPFPYTTEDAEWWVSTGCKAGINRAIEFGGSFIGVVGITPGQLEYGRSAEIGYWLGEAYWGKGLATRAVQQFTDTVFQDTDIVRIFGLVFSPNVVSMKVLEKCGYLRESVQTKAVFKYEQFYDAHIFAKIKS